MERYSPKKKENMIRHLANLSLLHGFFFHGTYFHEGKPQPHSQSTKVKFKDRGTIFRAKPSSS